LFLLCVQGFASSAQPFDWSDLEPAFRSALLKLHFSDNLLTPLPPGQLSDNARLQLACFSLGHLVQTHISHT
jgi:hypothetical protein